MKKTRKELKADLKAANAILNQSLIISFDGIELFNASLWVLHLTRKYPTESLYNDPAGTFCVLRVPEKGQAAHHIRMILK